MKDRQNGEHRKNRIFIEGVEFSILTILLDECQTKNFEENEHSTQSNSQVLYHQSAFQAITDNNFYFWQNFKLKNSFIG